MHYFHRRDAGLLARYFLCATLATVLSACGGSGNSTDPSSPASTPTTTTTTTASQSVNPPSITGTPVATVVAGAKYSFQPSASDTDGDALTFSIQNIPSWATFDTTSGLLTGMPTASNVGSYQSITISVADGKAIADLPPFTIQVTAAPSTPPVNTPPTITGSPSKSVQAGSHYAFQPSASDSNGDPLVFSITGKPSWASFSTSTGLLSGTPASNNVGNFPSIVISVSDGTTSVALAA